MISGLGVGIPPSHGESDPAWYATATAALRPAWWYTWRADAIGQPGFVPMCWKMDIDSILPAVDVALANAASIPLWLIGNEPEISSQSNTPYHQAAAASREWVRRLGTWAVPWACPGVNMSAHMFDQGRGWLDGYLAAKGPVPFVWHIHIYGGAQAFMESVHEFYAWMRLRHVERPIIVSECSDDKDPGALLAEIRRSLSAGEIQAAAWFSARYKPWPACDLLTDDCKLTEIGRLFLDTLSASAADDNDIYIPLIMR